MHLLKSKADWEAHVAQGDYSTDVTQLPQEFPCYVRACYMDAAEFGWIRPEYIYEKQLASMLVNLKKFKLKKLPNRLITN